MPVAMMAITTSSGASCRATNVPDHLCLSTDIQAANGQIYRKRAMARPLLPHGVAWQASRLLMS